MNEVENSADVCRVADEARADKENQTESELGELKKELESERRRYADAQNRMKYLEADIVNLSRQSERAMLDARIRSRVEFSLVLIPIKEDLSRALSLLGKGNEAKKLSDGLGLILSRIEGILRSYGVEEIKAEVGGKFDPHFHEAVAFSETNDKDGEGKIQSIIQTGYLIDSKVLRPALVDVGRYREKADGEDNKKTGFDNSPMTEDK